MTHLTLTNTGKFKAGDIVRCTHWSEEGCPDVYEVLGQMPTPGQYLVIDTCGSSDENIWYHIFGVQFMDLVA